MLIQLGNLAVVSACAMMINKSLIHLYFLVLSFRPEWPGHCALSGRLIGARAMLYAYVSCRSSPGTPPARASVAALLLKSRAREGGDLLSFIKKK